MRRYLVGGSVFGVELETPWQFMAYSSAVQQRIDSAASGEVLDVIPTRAGDIVPARTYVKSKEELHVDNNPKCLDFSQYEPFLTDLPISLFKLKILSVKPNWIDSISEEGEAELIFSEKKTLPYYFIYKTNGDSIFTFEFDNGCRKASLFVSEDKTIAEFYPEPDLQPYSVMFYLGMAMMIIYSNSAASTKALLIHASVIEHNGKANLFLGESGTGKSTHSRSWLDYIEGSELINDDNPIIKFESDGVFVYGTPWSGKTPCYRNKKVPVRAIVSLKQAPHNSISRNTGLSSYAYLLSAISAIRWDRKVMDGITSTASDIAMNIPFWTLECLPDRAAAEICQNEIEKNG